VDHLRETIGRLPREPAISCELRAIKASGAPVWLRARVSSMAGVAAVVVVEDISRKRAEAEVLAPARRSSEPMRAAAGIYMWRHEPDDDEYFIDSSFLGGDGWSEAGVRAAELMHVAIHPDDRDEVLADWGASLLTGQFVVTEYRDLPEPERWRRQRSARSGVRRMPSGRWLIEGVTQDITEAIEARDAALRRGGPGRQPRQERMPGGDEP
jgi:PAS domain-containing protein